MALQRSPATNKTPLPIVLENYFLERTDLLPSKKAARTAGRIILESLGENARVGDVTESWQKDFARERAELGNSLGYIERTFSVLGAALRHAKLTVPLIVSESHMRDIWKIIAKPPRKAFVPTDHQLATILRRPMPEDLARWLLISMATACRPQAAVDLAPAARIRDAQAIDLNPGGRAQNKKVRPVVRCPRVLTMALDRWERDGLDMHDGRYCGYASVDSADSALERVCKPIGLGRMSVYSIRHKVTTILRAAGVPGDQISRQLGHRGEESATTGGYGEYSPHFQREAAAALDRWIRRLRALKLDDKLTSRKAA